MCISIQRGDPNGAQAETLRWATPVINEWNTFVDKLDTVWNNKRETN